MDNYYANIPIYLDLGGALTAFGLIFAVYQLRKPQWNLVLGIRDSWQKTLFWIFGSVGLFLSLIRVLLYESFIYYWPFPFDKLLFYEIIAYLFFIASPLSLIYFSTKTKGLFNKKTSRKFYEVMVHAISNNNDEIINATIEVLLDNFINISEAARENKKDDEMGQSARAILDVILSDESVVKILTTKRLDALLYIFGIIDEYKISRRESGIGIPKIVQNLFYDKESFLYKHLGNDGLALSSNIYKSIFDSPVILKNFDLFGYPTLEYSMRKEIGLSGIKVFIEALSRSITTYLKTGDVPPRHINNGLSHLSEIFGDLCLKISLEDKRGVDTQYSMKDEWLALHHIAHFLGHDYLFLAYEEKLDQQVSEKEKTASDAKFLSDSTINAGIAEALYKSFEQLSHIENTSDTYQIALELLHGMMFESELKEGYRGPFEKRMWKQIAKNIVQRFYPATLRTYLILIGFCLASDQNQRQGWIGEQSEKMRELLYIDLKPLLDVDAVMINKKKMKDALLPESMDYKNGKFIYITKYGDEKEIPPPISGSISALKGIDLGH
jgi:hypothetical protein